MALGPLRRAPNSPPPTSARPRSRTLSQRLMREGGAHAAIDDSTSCISARNRSWSGACRSRTNRALDRRRVFMLFDELNTCSRCLEVPAPRDRPRRYAEVPREERRAATLLQIIGASPAAVEAKRIAARAHVDTTVLLLGETGPARKARQLSTPPRPGPMARSSVLNVAAIPESTLESSFREPARDAFVAATGAPLLDDVGEADGMQAKRCACCRRRRSTARSTASKVDVRVVAASSVDLARMVSMGRPLRPHYRLSVLAIESRRSATASPTRVVCDHILDDIARRRGRARARSRRGLTGVPSYAAGHHPRAAHLLEQVTLNSDHPRLSPRVHLVMPLVAISARAGERPDSQLAERRRRGTRRHPLGLAAADGKKSIAGAARHSRATL